MTNTIMILVKAKIVGSSITHFCIRQFVYERNIIFYDSSPLGFFRNRTELSVNSMNSGIQTNYRSLN